MAFGDYYVYVELEILFESWENNWEVYFVCY